MSGSSQDLNASQWLSQKQSHWDAGTRNSKTSMHEHQDFSTWSHSKTLLCPDYLCFIISVCLKQTGLKGKKRKYKLDSPHHCSHTCLNVSNLLSQVCWSLYPLYPDGHQVAPELMDHRAGRHCAAFLHKCWEMLWRLQHSSGQRMRLWLVERWRRNTRPPHPSPPPPLYKLMAIYKHTLFLLIILMSINKHFNTLIFFIWNTCKI